MFCGCLCLFQGFLLPLFLHAARYSESSCYGGENADDNLYQRFPSFLFHHEFPFFLVVNK